MQIEVIGTSGAFAPGPNVSMIIWPKKKTPKRHPV